MTDAVVVRDNEQAFEELKNADARALRKKALVVDPSDQAEEGQVIEAVKGKTAVLTHSPNHVVIETAPSCRGLLATAEVDYPGWEVFVDGRRGRILKTNFLFRGVMLPGGQRKVEFRFRSKTLCAGIVVSLVTVGLLAIYLLVLIWRRRLARSIEAGGR